MIKSKKPFAKCLRNLKSSLKDMAICPENCVQYTHENEKNKQNQWPYRTDLCLITCSTVAFSAVPIFNGHHNGL